MAPDRQQLERDPDYWWLRFRYATRDGDEAAAAEARQRLKALGISVEVKESQAGSSPAEAAS